MRSKVAPAKPRRSAVKKVKKGLAQSSAPLYLPLHNAPVAQLDRASDYESEGRTFESFRARHFSFPRKSVAYQMIQRDRLSCIGPTQAGRDPLL
jgi:hypothetical protein